MGLQPNGTLRVAHAPVFVPLIEPYWGPGTPGRYKGAFGGRGSGKSFFFATLAVARCVQYPGTRIVCVREIQKSLRESVKTLIEDRIDKLGVGSMFGVREELIRGPGDGLILFQGMKDHTAESIKSLEGFDIAYAEEAQTLSKRSLEMLRPTLRKDATPDRSRPGSELWFSWNPRSAADPVDIFLRGPTLPPDSVVVKANYNDNPFFPDVLESERVWEEVNKRDRYSHIWLGDYEPVAEGAIWNRLTIHQGRRNTEELPDMQRIVVAIDPAMSSNEGSDEHGIIVCGLGEDGRGYVLEDCSLRGSPERWANRALAAYDQHDADAFVCEVNAGGDLVRRNIEAVRKGPRIIEVRASRGKHIRAEPIASLYALGKISHVGTFPVLEDQFCLMTAGGYEGEGSPDRADAAVYGFTELFPRMTRRSGTKGGVRPTKANSSYDRFKV